jgi:predicted RNA-binding protein with PIN domain
VGGVRVIYSKIREEADEVIERMSRENAERGVGKFIVVSDDGIIRDVSGGYGATIIGSGSVLNEIKAMRKGIMGVADQALERVSGESKYSKRGWRVEDNLDNLEEIKMEIERRRKRRKEEEEKRRMEEAEKKTFEGEEEREG